LLVDILFYLLETVLVAQGWIKETLGESIQTSAARAVSASSTDFAYFSIKPRITALSADVSTDEFVSRASAFSPFARCLVAAAMIFSISSGSRGRPFAEQLVAGFGDEDVVFNAHAQILFGNVDTGAQR